MSGGPSLPGNPQPAYQYGYQPQADQTAFGEAAGLPNYAQTNYPMFNAVAGNVTSGAYGAPQIQGAGNTAITGGQNIAQAGQAAIGQGQSLVPYATQTLNTAFDPQNANFNQQFGQQQQQSGVNNAVNGVAGTPYGAGVTNAADNAFDLNWQNQQLARQQTGAGTAEGLLAGANSGINTAANAYSTGTSGAATGAGLLQSVPNESLTALNALNTAGGQATGVNQMTVQDLLTYLQGGTSAANAGTSQYSAESNASLGQQGVNNQQLAGFGSFLPTLLGSQGSTTAAGTGLMGLLALSDRRLKTNIERLGIAINGLTLYRFNYIWGGAKVFGHMADEVELLYPDAVFDVAGFKAVDYGALGW